MRINTYCCRSLAILLALHASILSSEAQTPYTLSEAEQEAMSTSLGQLTEDLAAEDEEPGRTNMILQSIDAVPPATLSQAIALEAGESYLDAAVRRIENSEGSLFAELRNGQSQLFSSLDERIWVAKQYVSLLALVTDTENFGGELPKIWNGRTNDVISGADEFRLKIIAEIATHIEKGNSLSEEEERNLWIASAGDPNAYGRLCTLLVARKAISRQSIYEEVLEAYLSEGNPHVLDMLIKCIISSGNLVFSKQLSNDLLLSNASLSVAQREALQKIIDL